MQQADLYQVIFPALLALIFPFLSFLLPLLLPSRLSPRSGIIAAVLTGLSVLPAIWILMHAYGRTSFSFALNWITIGDARFTAGIFIDETAAIMLFVIALINFLVHLYSLVYMKGEQGYARYWSHLGLFCFAMMGLVLADNLLLIYICWELVGFASYLLIGFWFTCDQAAYANTKAFLINRIGDMGFLIALFILFAQFGTLNLGTLSELYPSSTLADGQWIVDFNAGGIRHFSSMPEVWITLTGICLFLGAAGKSAQFPLHTWLPDAMEGPTPVSSLIHAATMVAVGVYMLIRTAFMLDATALTCIALTGAFTALMAATIALTQHDIKKILAYSTISQLGLMITGIGMQAAPASFMHLVAHAFFKCLLFLAAGSVILYLKNQVFSGDHQDIRLMGGLRKKLPVTFYTFMIAACALMGLPLFSGFLSKDALMLAVFSQASVTGGWAWIVAASMLLTTFLTGCYVSRLGMLVFFGEEKSLPAKVKEGTWLVIPMIVLAACCFFPAFGPHPFRFNYTWFDGFKIQYGGYKMELIVLLMVIAFTLAGALITLRFIRMKKPFLPRESKLYRFFQNKWYLDEFPEKTVLKTVHAAAKGARLNDQEILDPLVDGTASWSVRIARLVDWFDRYVVDGIINFTASFINRMGNFVRMFQTGKVQTYVMLALIMIIIFYFLSYIIKI